MCCLTAAAQDGDILTPGDFHQQEWQRLVSRYQGLDEVQPTRNQANMDVIHYRLDIDITDTAWQIINGVVTMTAMALVDNYTETDLNFSNPMTVDSVIMAGHASSWTHTNDLITITWSTPLDSGDTFTTEVYYHGVPPSSGFGSFTFSMHNGHSVVWSLSEPTGARDWWACKDVPNDKADSTDVLITADDANISTSNGLLREVIDNGNGTKTYHWHESYPISTYLVSITSTNYQTITDEYVTMAGDTMPITHYVYPEDYDDAVIDFDITPSAIEILRGYFGEYPFTAESYGMAEFNWGGAMEHQTLTTYGQGLIQGNHAYDWILVHELGHQWWGDLVTLDDWPHIWLNEGFASYSEALYIETTQGISGYHNYMQNNLYVSDPSGPIYDPDPLFGSNTVYHKGAWVLHMLRGVVGDSIWSIFPDYRDAYAYSNATTQDFQVICENVWGSDLSWFFQEWIWGVNRPDYQWGWDGGFWDGSYHLYVTITQQQTSANLFTMPIQMSITGSRTDTTVVLWDSLETQVFEIDLPWEPSNVELDPDQWILRFEQEGIYPLTIVTDTLLPGYIEILYADTLRAIGGVEPYTWEITSGTLPAGLTLDSLSGVISGIPSSDTLAAFTIKVSDDASASITQEFVMQIFGVPEAVDDLVIERTGSDVVLRWSPVEIANAYTIYRGVAYGLPLDSLTTVTDTFAVDSGILESFQQAFYQVTARREP